MDATFTMEDSRNWNGIPLLRESKRLDGYRGIWYALGHKFPYGDKYSGGLGTYTANHQPMAVYAPAVNKTFFTYGGTPAEDKRQLAIMVSFFDHSSGLVPRPVILYLDPAVDDPHDNASIQIDEEGYVWVFKSGRGIARPGLIFRSSKPYDIAAFELLDVQEFTYPQIHRDEKSGFFLLFTKYTFQESKGPARKLFWKTSADRKTWSQDFALAAFEGHYQTSGSNGVTVATFFNWHPGSDVDKRTNLYYAQTRDWGKTWTRADGQVLSLPLKDSDNAALVIDYHEQGRCMYTCDLNFDAQGNPVLLYISSRKGEPGPVGGPREWTFLHWKDGQWKKQVVTASDHNYDMGSLYIEGKVWKIIGPTEDAPQQYGTGGEMALWISRDEGETWTLEKQLTQDSPYNHSYARRPQGAVESFQAFWADGNPEQISRSHLFFAGSGAEVFRLPYLMNEEWASPQRKPAWIRENPVQASYGVP